MDLGPFASEPLFEHRVVTLAPSWECSSQCAHCFIPQDFRRRPWFDWDVIDSLLADLPESIKVIGLTGGEPFEKPDHLLKLLRRVHTTGRFATVVTNGLWSAGAADALELLKEAFRFGLRGLAISLDDYHRPRLEMDDAVSLLSVARRVGLAIHVKGVGYKSRSMVARLHESGVLLEQERPESQYDLEKTGAASRLSDDRVCEVDLDYCVGAMESFVVPGGEVFACCSPQVFNLSGSVLELGNVLREGLGDILGRASRSYLLGALVSFGVGGMLRIAGRKVTGEAASRCSLCSSVLSDHRVLEAASAAIRSDLGLRKEIAGRLLVYETCYRPEFLPEVLTD